MHAAALDRIHAVRSPARRAALGPVVAHRHVDALVVDGSPFAIGARIEERSPDRMLPVQRQHRPSSVGVVVALEGLEPPGIRCATTGLSLSLTASRATVRSPTPQPSVAGEELSWEVFLILPVVTAYDADAFDAYEASGWRPSLPSTKSIGARSRDGRSTRCSMPRVSSVARASSTSEPARRRRGPRSGRSDCDRRGCCCCDGRDCCTTTSGRTVRPSLGDVAAVRRRIVGRSRGQHCHPAPQARASGARACASARLRRARRAVDGDAPERSPFFAAILGAVADADVPPPTGIPAGPSFFQFADDVVFAALLQNAGFAEVQIDAISLELPLDSAEDLVAGQSRARSARVHCCEPQTRRKVLYPRVTGGTA